MRESAEDYMRAIYALYELLDDQKQGVKSVDIANRLGISKPSVSVMIKKLIADGWLEARPYSKIHFSEKGFQKAKQLTHNYRVIEVFLQQVLNYDSDHIREEAHRLEHAFSEESIRRLDEFLKNPQICPHGATIPH